MASHPQFEEDLELYELGVLDGSDKAELETHLTGCPECRAKLEAARASLALLALAAPDSDPSPAARERVLKNFRETGPESGRERGPARHEALPAPPARRGFWSLGWAWAMAGVCVALLGVSAWMVRENSRLSRHVAELEANHQELEASSQALKAAAARAQAVLEVLTGAQTVQVELSPSTAHPAPHGKAFYNRDRGLLFYTANLNALPSDKTYELWLIPTEGKPVDIGIFNTDNQGNGQVLLPSLPQGLTAKAFAVTVEPAGGVPAPTGAMVLVGPVS